MIANDHLDFHIRIVLGEVCDRHFGGCDRTRPTDIGVEARHVAEHAYLYVHLLGARRTTGKNCGKRRKS
ncbi:MAG TPA: hypothetical protein VFI76_09120 [Terrimicrobiaceae bacterium]|nr:hypothetical protein [Terrimicrobiaceae bacterium]